MDETNPTQDLSDQINTPDEMDDPGTQPLDDSTPTRTSPAPPAPLRPSDPPEQKPPTGYYALWVIVLASLLLNAFTIQQLFAARQISRQAIADAIAVLDSFQDQTFSYQVIIDETIPLETDIPFRETIIVPIKEDIPVGGSVSTSVNIPLLGTVPLNFPISAVAPVDIEVEVPIDQTVHVNAAVPIYLEVPIVIAVADTPLDATLEDTILRMQTWQEFLSRPFLVFPE